MVWYGYNASSSTAAPAATEATLQLLATKLDTLISSSNISNASLQDINNLLNADYKNHKMVKLASGDSITIDNAHIISMNPIPRQDGNPSFVEVNGTPYPSEYWETFYTAKVLDPHSFRAIDCEVVLSWFY
jgi:hypothetical protein